MKFSLRIMATTEEEANHLESEYTRLKATGQNVVFSGRNATAPGAWDYVLHIFFDSMENVAKYAESQVIPV